jgi:hypothetical protein
MGVTIVARASGHDREVRLRLGLLVERYRRLDAHNPSRREDGS